MWTCGLDVRYGDEEVMDSAKVAPGLNLGSLVTKVVRLHSGPQGQSEVALTFLLHGLPKACRPPPPPLKNSVDVGL